MTVLDASHGNYRLEAGFGKRAAEFDSQVSYCYIHYVVFICFQIICMYCDVCIIVR